MLEDADYVILLLFIMNGISRVFLFTENQVQVEEICFVHLELC